MLVKFDAEATEGFPRGFYQWKRQDVLGQLYQITRRAAEPLNDWALFINIDGCITSNIFPQDENEDLINDFTIPAPFFFGTCDDPNPVLNLRMQSYATIDKAQEDYPDVLDWIWPPY